MTMGEASERYGIPLYILREYGAWGLGGAAAEAGRYDDRDIQRLSVLMSLHDMGFASAEAEVYMGLLEQPHSEDERLRMLEEKRSAVLAEIHTRERQLQRLDYLRHEIRKVQRQDGR